jgi:5-methylcytosine-specific restriction endonuclease McrA
MRHALKVPVPELFRSRDAMDSAVDAHLSGDFLAAAALFKQANDPALESWLYPEWEKCHLNVADHAPVGDTRVLPKADRQASRFLSESQKTDLIKRDGYHCRYCGIPVIRPEVRKAAHRLYPEVVPWHPSDWRQRHMGFQALWLQFDHVMPHSHGGASDDLNSVVSCALCNFGKDKYTLRQLGLSDPRDRPPVASAWDGLERLMSFAPPSERPKKSRSGQKAAPISAAAVVASDGFTAFFLPGAKISQGYVYSPPLAGKERWFTIGAKLQAEMLTYQGVAGCKVVCSAKEFVRRGIPLTEVERFPEA